MVYLNLWMESEGHNASSAFFGSAATMAANALAKEAKEVTGSKQVDPQHRHGPNALTLKRLENTNKVNKEAIM